MSIYLRVYDALRAFPDGATAAQIAETMPDVWPGSVSATLSALKNRRRVARSSARPAVWRAVEEPADEVAELRREVERLRGLLAAIEQTARGGGGQP